MKSRELAYWSELLTVAVVVVFSGVALSEAEERSSENSFTWKHGKSYFHFDSYSALKAGRASKNASDYDLVRIVLEGGGLAVRSESGIQIVRSPSPHALRNLLFAISQDRSNTNPTTAGVLYAIPGRENEERESNSVVGEKVSHFYRVDGSLQIDDNPNYSVGVCFVFDSAGPNAKITKTLIANFNSSKIDYESALSEFYILRNPLRRPAIYRGNVYMNPPFTLPESIKNEWVRSG